MDQLQLSQQNDHSDNTDITMGDDFDNLVYLSSEYELCTNNYQIDDVLMPPNNFADPNEPPDDFFDQNEPPVPDDNPHIPPDDFTDQNKPPVPNNNPHIPPDDFTNQNEPPVPNNAPECDGHQQEYQFVLHHQPWPNIDVEALSQMAVLPKIKETMDYILALQNASLEDPIAKLDDTALERLCNPPREPVVIDSLSIQHSISLYLALEHASQEAYNRIQRSTKLNFAGAAGVNDILSFYNIKKLIAQYTGVESIKHNMCPKSCLAFMGPLATLECCPMCNTSWWDQARLHASNGHTKVAGCYQVHTDPVASAEQGNNVFHLVCICRGHHNKLNIHSSHYVPPSRPSRQAQAHPQSWRWGKDQM